MIAIFLLVVSLVCAVICESNDCYVEGVADGPPYFIGKCTKRPEYSCELDKDSDIPDEITNETLHLLRRNDYNILCTWDGIFTDDIEKCTFIDLIRPESICRSDSECYMIRVDCKTPVWKWTALFWILICAVMLLLIIASILYAYGTLVGWKNSDSFNVVEESHQIQTTPPPSPNDHDTCDSVSYRSTATPLPSRRLDTK